MLHLVYLPRYALEMERDMMVISYRKLWKLLIDHNMNKTQLRKEAGLSTNVLAKLSKNESVSMDSLTRICQVLHCDLGDIAEVIDASDKLQIVKYTFGDEPNQLRVAENSYGGYGRE